MIIPFNTDAPIYHRPIATIGTIVLNVLVFLPIAFAEKPEDLFLYPYLVLQYGYWLPWQWVTSNYVHGGVVHLLGNMFVLWGIGLVLEGKIGWWRFLLLFNGIGIVQCAFEQTLALALGEGASFGASAIIYGLIAIAVVWAPSNELSCLVAWGWRIDVMELSISTFAMLSFAFEIALSLFVVARAASGNGIVFTSQILHIMGGLVGLTVGVAMVKWNWVDCDGWDWFSVQSGRHMRSRGDEVADVAGALEKIKQQERAKYQSSSGSTTPVVPLNRPLTSPKPPLANSTASTTGEAMLTLFRQQLATNKPLAAFATHQRACQQFPGWKVAEPEYVQLMQQMRSQQISEPMIPVMLGYLHRYSERIVIVRLALAQLLVQLQRPRQAMAVLQKLTAMNLDPQQKQSLLQWRGTANQLAAQGLNEPPVQDW